jgi:hypothetical protein
MKPKIIEVKEPSFEQRKPPENIVFSYDPNLKIHDSIPKKSFFANVRSFFRF